jgi:NADH:ubiquinone oxidoreductase subunit 6 (subunit J)
MQILAPLTIERRGAMNLVYGVVALVAFFVITGVGLIILYSVQNTASTAVSSLTANQSGNLTNLFNSLTGAYLMLPIVGIVLVASMIIGGFFLFVRPT